MQVQVQMLCTGTSEQHLLFSASPFLLFQSLCLHPLGVAVLLKLSLEKNEQKVIMHFDLCLIKLFRANPHSPETVIKVQVCTLMYSVKLGLTPLPLKQ